MFGPSRSLWPVAVLAVSSLVPGCKWIAPYGSASSADKDAQPVGDGALDGGHTSEARPLTDFRLSEGPWGDASATFSAPWLKQISSSGSVGAPLVATDPSTGNIVVALDFRADVDAGDGETLDCAGETDILLASYDSSGSLIWKTRFGDASRQNAQGLAVDDQGRIVLAGYLGGSIDFGGGALDGGSGGGIFIASFDRDGTHRWSRRLTSADSSPSLAVGTDASGDVYVVGEFSGVANLGGDVLDLGIGSHLFVASYNPWGAHRFSSAFGSANNLNVNLAPVNDDRIVIAGTFQDTLTIDGHAITSLASSDGFLLSLEL